MLLILVQIIIKVLQKISSTFIIWKEVVWLLYLIYCKLLLDFYLSQMFLFYKNIYVQSLRRQWLQNPVMSILKPSHILQVQVVVATVLAYVGNYYFGYGPTPKAWGLLLFPIHIAVTSFWDLNSSTELFNDELLLLHVLWRRWKIWRLNLSYR